MTYYIFPLHIDISKCVLANVQQWKLIKYKQADFKFSILFTFTLKFPSEMILWLESTINNISDFIKSIELLTYG